MKIEWDEIVAFEPCVPQATFDIEVDPYHSFVANGLVVHNSAGRDPNLQNIPKRGALAKEFRKIFIPRDGYKLVQGDLSQAELRVAAWMAREPTMLKIYREGGDIHTFTAAALLNMDPKRFAAMKGSTKEIPASFRVGGFDGTTWGEYFDFKRYQAKAVNFGFALAEGQMVLTKQDGEIPIEQIKDWHLVWDGVEWVHHEGLKYCGEQKVISYDGIEATSEHEVFLDNGRKVQLGSLASSLEIGQIAIATVAGNPVRVPFADGEAGEAGEKQTVYRNGMLRVQRTTLVAGGQSFVREDYELQMSEGAEVPYWLPSRDAWTTIRCDGSEMPEMDAQKFEALQGQGDSSLVQIERELHHVGLKELAQGDVQGFGLRQEGQRRALLSREFATRQPLRKSTESFKKTYDLINAGPRHRFTVNGRLVSNCYGMGWRKFKEYAKTDYGLDLSDEEAQQFRNTFFRLYPKLEVWHRTMREFAREHGFVRALHGALRRLPSVFSDDEMIRGEAERQAINCLSSDTEILTVEGWKHYSQLTVGELVFSPNSKTGVHELQPLQNINVGRVNQRMLFYDGTISAIATPHHRWLVDQYSQAKETKGELVTGFKTSEELSDYGDHKIWLTGTGADVQYGEPWRDEDVELMGWVLTDGWYKEGGGPTAVGVTQSKFKYLEDIEWLFEVLGKHGYHKSKRGQHVWCISSEAGGRMRKEMPDKTLTAKVMMSLSPSQRVLLYETMLKGDGCWDYQAGRFRKFVAGTKDRADAFLMLCSLIGKPANAVERDMTDDERKQYESMGNIPKSGKCWLVELKQRNRAQSGYNKEWRRWKGCVWCPTVENGTWIAKRDGKVFVTGNSPVQRFASDLGLIAMGQFGDWADWDKARPLAFIHDAIVAEVREDYVNEAAAALKWFMQNQPLQEWFGITSPIPIMADLEVGDSLSSLESRNVEAYLPV